ncbi:MULTISPECIES: YcjF family protein [Bacillus cereus group]|uniref:YcjF family protein n=1 Tax=Bacillus cereus group TaxID=86661 RepID=UPI003877B272
MTTATKKEANFQDFWQEVNEGYKNLVKPNILIAGKTGVGKSTLINAVFRENLVETGVGRPVTQHLREISKESVPVNLFDTKGLELEEMARDEVKNEILGEIEKRAESPNADEHIHLMWYCISHESGRIEKEEIAWIEEFSKKMPVILVLTKCITDEDDLFLKEIDKLNLPVANIIKILATPKKLMHNIVIPPYGLKSLVSVTFQLLPEAVKEAFVNAQKIDLQLKIDTAKKWATGFIATSFGVGFTPIPFSDVIALSSMQLTMLAKITNIFGFSVSQDLFKAIISAIAGTGTVSLVGRAIVGNLLKLIPGIGTVTGGLINGTVASVLTTSLALAYIKVCEMLSQIENIEEMSAEEIAKMVKHQFEEQIKSK